METHTWAGDVLGRGPYQAVTALHSLRYRLERYPVVARRCLASTWHRTPLDSVVHQAGRRWHSDSDQPLRQFTPSARVCAAALRGGFSEHDRSALLVMDPETPSRRTEPRRPPHERAPAARPAGALVARV